MPSISLIRRREDRRATPFAAFVSFLLVISASAYSPDVNHRAIAGLWKLKQTPTSSSIPYPLKEFTVYPKMPKQQRKPSEDEISSKEVLLMLKEDGSFQQYSDQEQKIPDKLRFFSSDDPQNSDNGAVLDRYCEFGKLKGKWNLVGGRLILAADRPDDENGKPSSSASTASEDITDTFLEGEVVATTEEGLLDNPVLGSGSTASSSDGTDESKPNESPDNANKNSPGGGGAVSRASVVDTHLSVPKGRVQVGRFTYPKHHPSFFEAPMFNPRAGGKFELKQVLGTLNTRQEKDDEVFEEKFSAADFYNKTFLLTAHPIPEHRPKGNIRWSIKYNKFVEDPPKKPKKPKEESATHNIRVLEIKFFANNTFATIGGMGGSAILRGRFSVIGKEKDHIWMQVIRFGFGRSVSGSVFSEGRSLSKDDEKAYWGEIKYEQGDPKPDNEDNAVASETKMEGSVEKETDRKLIVTGSVLFGYGLEPMPVGLFVLTETSSMDLYEDYDDDDDDDDDFLFDSENVFQ